MSQDLKDQLEELRDIIRKAQELGVNDFASLAGMKSMANEETHLMEILTQEGHPSEWIGPRVSIELYLWRADCDQLKPVLVACPNGGYPHTDAEGHRIYENTHYHCEQDALDHIRDDVFAHISLAGRRVIRCQEELQQAQQQAGEAASRWTKFRDLHNR